MNSLKSARPAGSHYVLGVDLGTNSIGLALIDTGLKQIVHSTVRLFPAGMTGSDKDWENGKEASNAAKRRQQRGQRRQLDRRRRRLVKLFNLLKSFGWFPQVSSSLIQDKLNEIDRELSRKYSHHALLPYFLRARGLDHPLDLTEFARALYHLGQRRGFKSNRKTAPKADDDQGKVYQGIDSIRIAMDAANARTLGEYFAGLDPTIAKVRRNWTHRDMFIHEFKLLWESQKSHHPAELTDDRFNELYQVLFFQRPLKDQSNLIGFCDLEPTERRAPLRNLTVQRYRYLSALNNLRLYTPQREEQRLTQADRDLIINQLEVSESLKYPAIKKLLGLKASYKFSNEEGGGSNVPGNASAARIYAVVPALWSSLDAASRADLVEDLGDGNRYETDEQLYDALLAKWKLTPEEAARLSRTRMPDGYASLSLRAIEKILPDLECGESFAAVKHRVYPPKEDAPRLDLLPPVKSVFRESRNPAVLRSLSELRKCVNAFIQRYGKPDEIHIELARDLRRSRGERSDLVKQNRDNERARENAKKQLQEKGHQNPKAVDIEKVLLWEECGRTCPYSGKAISWQSLIDQPVFEIEHIIPYSRSLDNSRANKTLCHVDYNRTKGKRTPVEAFSSSDDWQAMVDRVKKFASPAKLRRFTMTETDTDKLLEDFSARQLTDTKYASRLAAKYLAHLYGGTYDSSGMRIVTCAGAVTAALRRVWDMNRILSDTPDKTRDDHRHHAVDAVAIALCSMKYIKALSEASANTQSRNPLKGALLADPWTGFREELREQILNHTVVGYRRTRKLAGPLHEETLYSTPHIHDGQEYLHIRKSVTEIKSEADLEAIVDPAIRAAVKSKLESVNGDAKRFEQDPPRMPSGVPIKKVRIRKRQSSTAVGDGKRQRTVITGDNHHMEVYAVLDQKGDPLKYQAVIVSRLEANRRHAEGLPVVCRDHGPSTKFFFSLSEGDMAMYAPDESGLRLFKVRGVSIDGGGRLELSEATDARLKDQIRKASALYRPGLSVFMKRKGLKVLVTPLGEVVPAND
jgi:CRISPR-associated endonuclease Csn1